MQPIRGGYLSLSSRAHNAGAFAGEWFTTAILVVCERKGQLRPGAQLPIHNNFQWNRILRAQGLLRVLTRFLHYPLGPPSDRLIAPSATPRYAVLREPARRPWSPANSLKPTMTFVVLKMSSATKVERLWWIAGARQKCHVLFPGWVVQPKRRLRKDAGTPPTKKPTSCAATNPGIWLQGLVPSSGKINVTQASGWSTPLSAKPVDTPVVALKPYPVATTIQPRRRPFISSKSTSYTHHREKTPTSPKIYLGFVHSFE